ncbi:hypothetical protein [Streptomyces triticisoli]|jgi:hypothetical protein|uniref:hypothetical protein n=1 Tax=Streptomyces triticisoli TaxID=2182797 RepID=UPI000DD8FE49|nr:hypothetical protein [Streptomyces triticisoli]
MKAQRARRLFATSAAGVLMATGVAVGTAGTAAAATPATTPAHVSTSVGHGGGCFYGGWWSGYCGFDRGGFFPYYNYGYNSSPVIIVVR